MSTFFNSQFSVSLFLLTCEKKTFVSLLVTAECCLLMLAHPQRQYLDSRANMCQEGSNHDYSVPAAVEGQTNSKRRCMKQKGQSSAGHTQSQCHVSRDDRREGRRKQPAAAQTHGGRGNRAPVGGRLCEAGKCVVVTPPPVWRSQWEPSTALTQSFPANS